MIKTQTRETTSLKVWNPETSCLRFVLAICDLVDANPFGIWLMIRLRFVLAMGHGSIE
ncbi:hypothetical protein RchiOBHm_Chr3g0475071 [Rosa chinensis]|uniref:Uncharacterized protein n=1 Tax=Rosa chinensis TaxID=74649 RepID=A0A2P6RC93_ROSCH|nr:hypothetical protein RchiOBHm_Chr3g0475071 [Rosa chinensis]